MSRFKLYDVCAVMPGGDLYFFNDPKPKPLALLSMHRARLRDFGRAVRLLLTTGYECYPIMFHLVDVDQLGVLCHNN